VNYDDGSNTAITPSDVVKKSDQHRDRNKKVDKSCVHCGRVFSSYYKLNRHEATVHSTLRPFQCTLCPLAFSREDMLKRHTTVVHSKATTPVRPPPQVDDSNS